MLSKHDEGAEEGAGDDVDLGVAVGAAAAASSHSFPVSLSRSEDRVCLGGISCKRIQTVEGIKKEGGREGGDCIVVR